MAASRCFLSGLLISNYLSVYSGVDSFRVDNNKLPYAQSIDCTELSKVCLHKVSNTITSFDKSYLETGVIPEWVQWGLHVAYHDNENRPRHMRTRIWKHHGNNSFAHHTPVTSLRVTHQNGDIFYGGSRHYPLNIRLATVFDTPYEPFRSNTNGLLIVSEWLENIGHSMYALSAMRKAFEEEVFSGDDADIIFASGDGGPILNFTYVTWNILPHRKFVAWDNVCYEHTHLCRVNSDSLDKVSQANLWPTSQAIVQFYGLNSTVPKASPLAKTQLVTIAIRERAGGSAPQPQNATVSGIFSSNTSRTFDERGWLNAKEILSFCNSELATSLRVTDQAVSRFANQKHDDDSPRPSQMPLQAAIGNPVFRCQTHVFGRNQTRDIEVAQESDVLIGVHGAALMHSLFMKENSHMIEIISKHAPEFVDMHYRTYMEAQGYKIRFWRIVVKSDALIAPSSFERKRIGNKIMWGRDNSMYITKEVFEQVLRSILETDTSRAPLEKFNSLAVEGKNIFNC